MSNKDTTYLKKWLRQIINLRYANKLFPYPNYEETMEQLLHELIDIAIDVAPNKESNLAKYHNSILYYGIDEDKISEILKEITKLL